MTNTPTCNIFVLPSHSGIRGAPGENNLDLTPEAFDKFLLWLSPDREESGRKYEELHRKLTRYFTCKGCDCPERLADQTIDRVVRKLASGTLDRDGEPIIICYGFARNIYLEWFREQQKTVPLLQDVAWFPP